jgi:pimeloyl-ACP methyl ester carboxylesterase
MRRLAAVLIAIATTLATVPAAGSPTGAADSHDAPEPYETTVPSFDGHEVPIRVYEAADSGEAPTLLWGHGWGGSYADSTGDGSFFAERGYNVVAMDFRGHGQARDSSLARVHSVDHEIRDVRQVIDWIAQQGFAELEDGATTERAGGDPVLGALGGSYGGGYQLLTAAQDDRLDAIAPEITWNSLPQSLAPNGAVQSTWVDALYGAGVAQASLADFIHQGYAWATAANEFPDGELPGEPDVEGQFRSSSPEAYPGQIQVPTLLIQGMPDLLFPLNEAIANAQQIAPHAEVRVVGHLGGHVLNTDGTLGADEAQAGIQHPSGPSPCGDDRQLAYRWYEHHLKDGADPNIPPAALATDEGRCVAGDEVYDALTDEGSTIERGLDDIVLPQGAPVASGYAQAEREARAPSPVQRTVLDPDSPVTVAGIPTLEGVITVAGSQAIVYASLVHDDGETQRVVHDQVVPLRQDGPVQANSFQLDLAGVAVDVGPGEELRLELSTTHPMYGDNGNRQPGAVVLEDLSLTLPEVAS